MWRRNSAHSSSQAADDAATNVSPIASTTSPDRRSPSLRYGSRTRVGSSLCSDVGCMTWEINGEQAVETFSEAP